MSEEAKHTRSFVNELGNLIKITIEGPTSTSENTLTKLEANALRDLLFQKLGIPEIANPAGETIRPAQGGAMEAAPVTGEQPVGAASTPMTEEAKHTPTMKPCPFCESEATLDEFERFAVDAVYRYAAVRCTGCHFSHKEVQAGYRADDPEFGSKHIYSAIAAWNTRAYFMPKMVAAELTTLRTKLAEAESDERTWRDLALQFDGHRMEAMALLRYVSEASTAQEAARRAMEIRPFLAKPPLSGEAVLAARIAFLSQTQDPS